MKLLTKSMLAVAAMLCCKKSLMLMIIHDIIIGIAFMVVSFSAMASTQACPVVNTFTGLADPDHYVYSGQTDGVPLPCNTCEDPANAQNVRCKIYQFLHSSNCQASRCQDKQGVFRLFARSTDRFALQYDTRYLDPVSFPKAKGENCRFLIWALEPSAGLEDANSRNNYPYWHQAWKASQQRVRPAFHSMEVGFIIQPYSVRGQHQLHIHIGKLFPKYREAIDSLISDPKITQTVSIEGVLFYARYVLDIVGKGPFTGANPFEVARSLIPEGESALADFGILAARARDRKGIVVLVGDNLERDNLNYRNSRACYGIGMPIK